MRKCQNLNISHYDYEDLLKIVSETNRRAHEYAVLNTRHREIDSSVSKISIENSLTGKKVGFDLYKYLSLALTKEQIWVLETQKDRLEKKLSAECPQCGNEIVDSIYKMFDSSERERKTWEIEENSLEAQRYPNDLL